MLLVALMLAAPAQAMSREAADAPPLFEIGVVPVGGYNPDYPASDQSHFDGIALPYIVYRGSFLRAGEDSFVKGRLVHEKGIDLDVSLKGSFPTKSKDNDARRGMPDLDYLAEIGPRLQITLARAARDAKIELELPIRAVLSTNLSNLRYRGFVVNPVLAYQHDDLFGTGTKVKLGLGAIFADKRLMRYFYEVEPAYATPTRPAYSAEAGYLGSEVTLALLKRLSKSVNIFALAAAGFYGGTANENSPLHKADTTYGVNLGFTWSFYQSEARGVE